MTEFADKLNANLPLALKARIAELKHRNAELEAAFSEANAHIAWAREDEKRLLAEVERLKSACIEQNYSIEQTLGRALGYVEADGTVNTCDHTAETLADEAERELAVRDRALRKLAGNVRSLEMEINKRLAGTIDAMGYTIPVLDFGRREEYKDGIVEDVIFQAREELEQEAKND